LLRKASENLLTSKMIIERTEKEILVRLSPNTNTSDLQDMLDFLEYRELVSKSKASDKAIEELSKEVNKSMMTKISKDQK